MNAPRWCPKSVDSSSVSGTAEQFSAISGLPRLGRTPQGEDPDRELAFVHDLLVGGVHIGGDVYHGIGILEDVGEQLEGADHFLFFKFVFQYIQNMRKK